MSERGEHRSVGAPMKSGMLLAGFEAPPHSITAPWTLIIKPKTPKRKQGLRLGLFTQDLAQQIDPVKVALDVVMETVPTVGS